MNEKVTGSQESMQLGQESSLVLVLVLVANHLQNEPVKAKMKSAVLLVSSY